MAKLCSRDRVKQIAGLRPDATDQDEVIDGMLELLTAVVYRYIHRNLEYQENHEEYFKSYEQLLGDPQLQYLFLDAPTVDLTKPVTVTYSPLGDHSASYARNLILGTDYDLQSDSKDPDSPVVLIRSTIMVGVFTVPADPRGILYYDHPRGFKVVYSGGYVVDKESGVMAAPLSLQTAAAQKCATDFLKARTVLPLAEEEKEWFKFWRHRDVLFP